MLDTVWKLLIIVLIIVDTEGNVNIHDTDFQKLKKSGVCKFELKVKGNCKNSDKCKWSHQIPKPLYREKNSSK